MLLFILICYSHSNAQNSRYKNVFLETWINANTYLYPTAVTMTENHYHYAPILGQIALKAQLVLATKNSNYVLHRNFDNEKLARLNILPDHITHHRGQFILNSQGNCTA